MNQLTIETNVYLPARSMVYNLLKCPACSCHFDNEDKCFEHFLDHFENSKIFLFQRCNLVFWLDSYIRVAINDSSLTSHQTEIDKLNTVANVHRCVESKELRIYICEVCNKSFPNEDEIRIHNFVHFKVKVPAIDHHLKCPLCDRYYCSKESCLIHTFTHMKILTTGETRIKLSTIPDPFQFIKKWIIGFVCSSLFEKFLSKYTFYKQLLNSPLLSKLLWSEIAALKNCKFCRSPVTSAFDLLDNHRDCKPYNSLRSVFCVICNFKASNMACLVLHLFSDHVVCYCGYRGDNFDAFLNHTENCIAQKSGVICPCCHNRNFVTERAFKQHIEETKRNSCGSHFKKNKWVCVICKKQCSQINMFDHISTEHVSCVCGYKSRGLKPFFIHTAKCVKKKNSIMCPICRKTMCSTEDFLKQHLSRCFPWKEVTRCDSLKRNEGPKKTLKRKYEQLFVEIPPKKTKFSFKLNYINCASQ